MARPSTKTAAEIATAAEEKGARFRKVATGRVSKALEALDTIANCANKNTYVYTEEQVAKIEKALGDRVSEVMAMFRATDGAAPKKAIEL